MYILYIYVQVCFSNCWITYPITCPKFHVCIDKSSPVRLINQKKDAGFCSHNGTSANGGGPERCNQKKKTLCGSFFFLTSLWPVLPLGQ